MERKEYDRLWYEKNKLRIKDKKNLNTRKYRFEKRNYIIDLLKESKCKNCGNSDWRVLEFDHRDPKYKSFNIADGPNKSWEALKEEIEKCDILCANCHNIKTIEQRGYYKYGDEL